MSLLPANVRMSPMLVRAVPFIVFILLTSLQGQFGEAGRYWVYAAKTLVGAWLVWEMLGLVKEIEWKFSWEAIVVGVGVCVMWVGLDPYYPSLGTLTHKIGIGSESKPELPWNPHTHFGEGSALAWTFIAVRILGSTIVVPPLEEVFYRSFLYRYIVKPDFQSVSHRQWHPLAFFMTAGIFGFTHHQWLAGILCAFAYQGLVLWKGRLGDAIAAHAITNFLLGVWVVWKGPWQFW
jgi:uncharacterized protein